MVGHGFFEASSIRKVNDTYYFVYSSQNNHELCYATSKYSDKDFEFRGTIVSNGDVGFRGRKEKDRLNTTGTTHGSIECINGDWYVFYHRVTHGTDYSRQICAEKISILPDGSIPQVEMTSCGLNNGDLLGKGEYPAIICCNLTNGRMPHTANKVKKNIPTVMHCGDDRYVANIGKATRVVYKYFDLTKTNRITVKARGNGRLLVLTDDDIVGTITVNSEKWKAYSIPLANGEKHVVFSLLGENGKVDLLTINMEAAL